MGKTQEQISYNMSRVRSSGSEIERVMGSALWSAGIRYRKQYKKLPGRPDFALVADKIAIFCDSSFWHGRRWPTAADALKKNKDFWVNKIEYNINRDREVNGLLTDLGWEVIRLWDDEILKDTASCLQRVKTLVRKRRYAALNRIVTIDFFCGAGGMTQGLIRSGMHVLAGVDNERSCERTYRQTKNADRSRPEFICHDIFPKTASHPGGEQHLVADRIEELLREYKRKTGLRKLKLVFAICAPCQPFSKITKIEMSDPRKFKRENDMNLLLTTVRLIRHFRPQAIICENIEGIGKGNDSVLGGFQARLKRIGYSFDAKVVNAAKFGVPQNRRRTVCIGFNKEYHRVKPDVMTEDPSMKRFVSVRQAIGFLPPIAAGEVHPTIPNHRARSLNEINLKRISCARPGESNHYLRDTPYGDLSLSCHRNLQERRGEVSFTDTYTRMHGDAVGPTITTKFIAISNGRFGHFDVKQNRAISPREAALLQTFPCTYVFYPEDNLEFTATLIGNSVPPRLSAFFGRYIVDRLAET